MAQPRVPRLGYLSGQTAEAARSNVDVFRRALRELGYTEAQNITIEYSFTEGRPERLSQLVSELVARRPDGIITSNSINTRPHQKT